MANTIDVHEDRLEQLSELAQIGWWEADLKQQLCVCSAFICELLGLQKPSIRFPEFGEFIHRDFRSLFETEIRTLVPGRTLNLTFPLTLSCQEVWVNFRACIKHSPADKILGTLQLTGLPDDDRHLRIPEQNHELVQNVTKELADSEELFRNIFNYIPIGEELYTEEGIMYDINPKAMEIFGVEKKEDVKGISLFDNPNLPDEVKEAVRNKEIVEFTHTFYYSRVRDNAYYVSADKGQMELYTKIAPLYNYSGAFSGYICINIDNTEKVSMEKQIWNFEQLFYAISNYAKVGYARYNLFTQKGYAIQQWYENLGEENTTDLKDIIGNYSKLHPDDHKKILDYYKTIENNELKNFQAEVRVLCPGTKDEWKWICKNIIATSNAGNGQIELLGINYDITQLKETEMMLRTAKEKAERANRLKSSFLANISHEIRTPLNAIIGFSSILAEKCNDPESLEYAHIIETNNELLLQLINDILDLSKIESGKMEFVESDIDLNKVLTEILETTRFRLKTDAVSLNFEEFIPDFYIRIDKERLSQVLINFLTNAIKFTEQGRIDMGYRLIEEGTKLYFYVKDTGKGIEPEKQKEIFKRFVKLNSFVQGTGLGLSICETIVKKMNGKIGVNSIPGVGSEFWFTVPDVVVSQR